MAVGGDGTLNEVVNGIAGSDAVLATIPIGTGMDFGRTYGIPTKFDDAVRVAVDGDTRTIDAGRVHYRTWAGEQADRWFANVGSVGMSGAVAQRANGMSKALGGKATFFYALTRVFLEWENTEVTVRFDGGERWFANVASTGMSGAVARRANGMTKAFGGRATFYYALTREFVAWRNTEVTVRVDGAERRGKMHDVIVANGRWHGGGMKLAPDAEPDDGLFDVVLIGDASKLDFVTTSPKLYSGRYLAHPKVEALRGAVVEVDAAEPLPVELDGEPVGTTPVRFELVPAALKVRVPAG